MAYRMAYGQEKSARRRFFSSDLAEQAGFEPAVGY